MSLRILLLGPVAVVRFGRMTEVGPAKRQAMLAFLALNANQRITLAALTAAVWDGRPPASAVANLRTYANGLRRVVGDRLFARNHGYELRVDADELDADEFTKLAAAGRRMLHGGELPGARASLAAALDLWRGPAGGGLEPGAALADRLATLDQQRLEVFEDFVDASLGQQDNAGLGARLRDHLRCQPLRERAWLQLMLLHYRGGDIASALATYRDARAVLRDQLGVDPGRALTEVHRAILNRDPSLGDPAAPSGTIPENLRIYAAEATQVQAG